jgi:hypothetical protein
MKRFGKFAIGALMAGSAALAITTPAAARASIGISFGFGLPGYASFGPCDYYHYYDAPPPWGLPPNYCDDDVYFQPVFWDGEWYRGPIYYRWEDGERVFWLNGRWRRAEWRHHPYNVEWREHGREYFRGDHHYYRGYEHRHYDNGGYYHHEHWRYENRGYERNGGYEHSGFRAGRYGSGRQERHQNLENTGFRHESHGGDQHYDHRGRNEHRGQNNDHGGDHHHDQNGHS